MVKSLDENKKREYICTICKEENKFHSFKTKSSLNRHIRDKHSNIKKCT